MFFLRNNRMFHWGRLIEGGVYFLNFEKGGGRLFEGAFKRRGRLIEVIRYFALTDSSVSLKVLQDVTKASIFTINQWNH